MSTSQMDEAARAMCYAFRHPGSGQKPLKLKVIQKLLKKKDAKNRPSLAAISQAAANFTAVKKKQGRKLGQRATSKKDDKKIMEAFHKLRPPGHGIDSTALHKALPKKLKQKKIGGLSFGAWQNEVICQRRSEANMTWGQHGKKNE